MRVHKKGLQHLIVTLIGFMMISVIVYQLVNLRTGMIIAEKYADYAKNLQETTQSYIEAKSESTRFIALSLANDRQFIDVLSASNDQAIDMDPFVQSVNRYTKYKHIWIQISDKHGISRYRSWTDKRGDDLSKVRKDIIQMINNPKVTSTISTGIFDMTFKAMVPLYNKEKFIGTVEVITKFNSIAEQFIVDGFETVILVDKSYREQIKKPYTKIFLDDYYVTNINASVEKLRYIHNYGIEKLLADTDTYTVDHTQNLLVTKYEQKDIEGKDMAYFILFSSLENVDVTQIYFFHNMIVGFILSLLVGMYMVLQLIISKNKKEKIDLENRLLSKEVEEKDLKLEEQHHFLQHVINSIDQSIMVIDKEYNVLLANDTAKQFGIETESAKNGGYQKCHELSHHSPIPCDTDLHPCPLAMTLEERKSLQVIHKHLKPSGEEHYIELRSSPLYNKNNELYAIIEVGHDVTEHLTTQKILEEQKDALDYQAHYDELTSLPNRVLYLDRLKHAMNMAKRNQSKVAILFIDLDHFKEINDSIGHHAGDEVLKTCALRLKNTLRQSDTISRFGGDEFTVILENISHKNEIIDIVQMMLTSLKNPYQFEERKLYSGASIGISIYPDNGKHYQSLMKNADAAMYKAKEKGRNTYSFYTREMTENAYERIELETKLIDAVKHNALVMHYQPLVEIKTNKVIGYEALVRWIDTDGSVIPPNKFLNIAEQTSLINEMGKLIFNHVCKQAVLWKQMQYDFGKIAVNISTKQLKDSHFFSFIETLLAQTGCRPEWIEFEITESFIIEDMVEAADVLEKVSALGIDICLDDFGTGYSSLSYLKKLPIKKVKIDKSFIEEIPYNEHCKMITRSIISLAVNMNLEVLAEGVETKEQENFLVENGCKLAQGFYYDKPLSFEVINKERVL
jgi:diguanylate cyclase (GGDEF)-like protein